MASGKTIRTAQTLTPYLDYNMVSLDSGTYEGVLKLSYPVVVLTWGTDYT